MVLEQSRSGKLQRQIEKPPSRAVERNTNNAVCILQSLVSSNTKCTYLSVSLFSLFYSCGKTAVDTADRKLQ